MILQIIDQNEDRPRGTYEFPFEFHHIDHSHPRYVMSYHWHVEYEIIRILTGEFTVTLDEKSFKAVQGDVIFVHSGIRRFYGRASKFFHRKRRIIFVHTFARKYALHGFKQNLQIQPQRLMLHIPDI